jgi:hypothetical protein
MKKLRSLLKLKNNESLRCPLLRKNGAYDHREKLFKGIVEIHGCAIMVWDHIGARLVYDTRMI